MRTFRAVEVWRSSTTPLSLPVDRIPCGPPPCTVAATITRFRTPSGATTPSATSTATTDSVMMPPRRDPGRVSAASAAPTVATAPETASVPPIRAMPSRGPRPWVNASIDSGTPPNGACQRNHSPRTTAPGSAIRV